MDIRRSATLSRQGCESLAYLGAILEEATGISAKASEGGGLLTPRGDPYFPGVAVKFPGGQVRAADRVGMWVDGDHVRLAMWPAELMPQYTRVYSDPKKVEALIELENHAGWTLQANFQLAHRFAQPLQRWYPCRHLSGQEYVNQWIDDFHEGCAGGRTIDEIADPRFFDWLVERSYAHDSERGSLQEWVNSKPSRIQVHIRPGIEVFRSWPYADAFAEDRKGGLVAEIREAIDRMLYALDEPKLNQIRPR